MQFSVLQLIRVIIITFFFSDYARVTHDRVTEGRHQLPPPSNPHPLPVSSLQTLKNSAGCLHSGEVNKMLNNPGWNRDLWVERIRVISLNSLDLIEGVVL